jgi:hypothetical protein
MKKNGFLIVAGITLLVSCGSNEIEEKDDKLSVTEVKAVAENANKEIEKAKDRNAERRTKGDTVAMHYKDLQAYLPEIASYAKSGGPKGNMVNMPGAGSWSEVQQKYNNGDKKITVKIVDYNGSEAGFSGIKGLYQMGGASEDDEKKSGSIDLGIKDVAAFETVYKQKPRARLTLIITDRFMVNIESTGSNDMDMLTPIAKHIASGLAEK